MAAPTTEKCRLVTRSDFDGLVCAALLKELGVLDEIKFVHPKDMQDGLLEITERDITTNLPYVPGVRLAFDHHESETLRLEQSPENHIILPGALSAARVVYDYFGGAERFSLVSESLMEAVDKADSALFSLEEIRTPSGWILLSFLMDPRTGLGRFRDFRISNYELMMELIDACLQRSVEEILEMPDVAERVALYRAARAGRAGAAAATARPSTSNLVVVDLRDEDVIHPTNRFMVYALHPPLQHLRPRPLGPGKAEHGARDGQVDRRPLQQDRHRRADALLRGRRPRGGRHVPGRQRGRRARARRAGRARQRRRVGAV